MFFFAEKNNFERSFTMKKNLKVILSVVLAIALTFGTFAQAFVGFDFAIKSSAEGRSVIAGNEKTDSWLLYSDGELLVWEDIPDYSETVHAPWYNNAKQIKLIRLDAAVTKIGSYAFDGIQSATTLYISKAVTAISADAFKNFKSLSKVYFEGNPDEWEAIFSGAGVTVVYEHIHSDGQIKNAFAADCKNKGYTGDIYCSECYTFFREGDDIPNDNTKHVWTSDRLVKEEPTCSKEGVLARQCILCGAWKSDDTKPIAATGRHEYELKDENKLANCKKGAKVTLTCKYCDSKKEYILESDQHTYQYQVIDPTCLLPGETIETCKYCTHSITKDTVKALGHSATVFFSEPATCEKSGSYGYKCSRCGVICQSTKVAAYGHTDGDWVVTKEPGCKENGIKELRCARYNECGEVLKVEEILNLHDNEELRSATKYVKREPTCVEPGLYYFKCNNCSEDITGADGTPLSEVIPATPNSHKASRWVTVKDPDCTEPGLMIKKCTVEGCKYHSDNALGLKIDEASDDAALNDLITVIKNDVETKSQNENIVTRINNEILNAYYNLELSDDAKVAKLAERIEALINGIITITVPDDEADVMNEIVKLSSAAIVKDANVNNTKDSLITYFTNAFAEMGDKKIKDAVADASEKDIELVSLMTVDQQEIPALGHNYQVVSYYQTIELGKSVYTPVALGEDGKYYPIESYNAVEKDGETVYEPVFVPEAEAVDTSIHEIVTEVSCTVGGTIVEQCVICCKIQTTEVAKGNHDYVLTDVKATCTEQGYTEETCKNCTYVARYKYTPSIGHKWKEVIIKDSTCTKTGLKAKVCDNCGMTDETSYKPVALKNHDYKLTVVAPTCTEDGYTAHTCSVCGGNYKDNTVEKLGHKLKDTVVAPTCEENGYTLHSCSTCGYEYKDATVLATGHQYGESKHYDATCTVDAYTQRTCKICGDKETPKYEKGTAFGHHYIIDEAVEASCLSAGLTEGEHCDKCGDVKVEQKVIPALDHTVVNDAAIAATCETAGRTAGSHCSVCHTVIVPQTVLPATGHNVVEDPAVDPTCTMYGHTAGSHCENCGKIYVQCNLIDARGHSFGEWVVTKAARPFNPGTKTHTCTICGETETISYRLTFLQAVIWIFTNIFTVIRTILFGA